MNVEMYSEALLCDVLQWLTIVGLTAYKGSCVMDSDALYLVWRTAFIDGWVMYSESYWVMYYSDAVLCSVR